MERTIYINASTAHVGGALTYIRGWLGALTPVRERSLRPFRYVLLVNQGVYEEYPLQREDVTVVPVLPHSGRPSFVSRTGWDQIGVRQMLVEQPALLFSSANVALFNSPIPQVLLVRQSLYFSDHYMRRILPQRPLRARVAEHLRRAYLLASMQAVEHILVPSVAMQMAIRRAFPRLAAKVWPLPYVTDLPSAPAPARPSAQRPFIFTFPSHYADYKNFRNLLRAAMILVKQGYSFRLRLNAEPERFPSHASAWHAQDCQLFQDPALRPVLERVGPQTRSAVVASLRSSDALVIPSFAESYGHPFLEGMSQGLPIAASDLPISHEVAGPAAIYFDPWQPESIATALARLMDEPALSRRLQQAGRERVQNRGWGQYIQEFEQYCEPMV